MTPFKNRTHNRLKSVDVYRCLNRRGHVFSIRQNGLVIGHATELTLAGVSMVVNQAGKAKAIASGIRNVHAFLRGKIILSTVGDVGQRKLAYNPFSEQEFTVDGAPCNKAFLATINEKGVFIL